MKESTLTKGSIKTLPKTSSYFALPGLKEITVPGNLQLNPVHSFENFIEGNCNRTARNAALAIAERTDEKRHNPLFICGNIGLGKTHLASAIGLELQTKKRKNVMFISFDDLAQKLKKVIVRKQERDFIESFKMIDVLIVDNLHLLGTEKQKLVQDAFFCMLNALLQQRTQLVFTTRKHPIEIEGVGRELLSRLMWGLTVELTGPELDTRILILRKKIFIENLDVPNEVIEYLAQNITKNMRDLEGMLMSVIDQTAAKKQVITLDIAKDLIDRFVKSTAREIHIDSIQKIVCDYLGVPIEIMKSKTRKREVVQARQITMYFAKIFTKSSLANIGMQCGGKDHATVLHATKNVNDLIDTDKRFRKQIEDIENKINGN